MGSGSTRRPSGLYSKILQDPSFGPTEMSRLQPQVALAKSWLLSNQGQAPIETVAPITALIDCRDVDKQLIFFFCKCHLEEVLYLSLQGASNCKSLTNTQSKLPSARTDNSWQQQSSSRNKLLLLGFQSTVVGDGKSIYSSVLAQTPESYLHTL